MKRCMFLVCSLFKSSQSQMNFMERKSYKMKLCFVPTLSSFKFLFHSPLNSSFMRANAYKWGFIVSIHTTHIIMNNIKREDREYCEVFEMKLKRETKRIALHFPFNIMFFLCSSMFLSLSYNHNFA